jgi:hypothetical protein
MLASVFPSVEQTALEERNVRHVFTRMLENAELRQIRIHDLRHSYATPLFGAALRYLRRPAARAFRRLNDRPRLRALTSRRRYSDDDPLDEVVPAHPNAYHAHPESLRTDHVIATKSLRMNVEPRRTRNLQPADSATAHNPQISENCPETRSPQLIEI